MVCLPNITNISVRVIADRLSGGTENEIKKAQPPLGSSHYLRVGGSGDKIK